MGNKVRDNYTKYARVLPAVVSMILPCISTIYFIYHIPSVRQFFAVDVHRMWEALVVIFPCSLIYGAIGYSARELFRSISKIMFQYQLFNEDETKMPTTNLLIFSKSSFSENYILKIMQKIHADFGLKLKSKEEQLENEIEARKEIANVVQLIRNVTRCDKILLQYNIQFGFLRNFMGGVVVAFTVSSLLLVFSVGLGVSWLIHLIICIIDVFILISSFVILKYRARAYARQLYAAYLTVKL